MKTTLPFRQENEVNFLNKSHPLTRLVLPFILVLPFLILSDIYLTITVLMSILIFSVFFRLNTIKTISRLKIVLPLFLLIVIFIPFYVGNTIIFQIDTFIRIQLYQEGLYLASLIFLRVIGSFFIFISFLSSLTYSEFIEALTKLRIPPVFVGSLVIMLHYIPIFATSNKKILEAQEVRGKKISSYWQKLKTHAYIMGKSIVVNMERSEKLYESLKMRGFSGKITFARKKFKVLDIGLLVIFLFLMSSFIFILDLQSIFNEVGKLFLP